MTVRIGTSGWHYASWKGPFFPEGLKAKDQLRFYASQFPTTELNGVFYRTPTERAVESWRDQTPDDFVFAWKASKFITHWKRLSDQSVNSLELLESRLSLLGRKAGPVLFQLPPQFELNYERLQAFLKMLNRRRRYTFEFRHPSWFDDEVLALLRSQNRVLCISDRDEMPLDHIDKTADWGYVRLRRVNYSDSDLKQWAKRIKAQKWKDTYVFFKHEDEGTGPKLAAQFHRLARL